MAEGREGRRKPFKECNFKSDFMLLLFFSEQTATTEAFVAERIFSEQIFVKV